MILCLSSGARARYREDIIRALALPEGAILQFRYANTIVSPPVRELIVNQQLEGVCALIAFLDSSDNHKETEVYPCRTAVIHKAVFAGSSAIIKLKIGKYVSKNCFQELKKRIWDQENGLSVPYWNRTRDDLDGYFCDNVKEGELPVEEDQSIDSFEYIIQSLKDLPDFAGKAKDGAPSALFYRVEGFYQKRPGHSDQWDQLGSCDGVIYLDAGKRYAMSVYHYYPDPGTDHKGYDKRISVNQAGLPIHFISPTNVEVDSEYDVKRIDFRTDLPTVNAEGHIGIGTQDRSENFERRRADIEIPVRVNRHIRLLVAQAVLIGIFVSAPAFLSYFTSETNPAFWPPILMLAFGLVVGFTSTFGLRRSV